MIRLSPDSLDWALQHVEKFGDTDIFPVPLEYAAIRYSWDRRLRDYLAGQDLLTWKARPHRRCLSPKHRFGFRVSTQLDPLDTLIFTALVYDIGPDAESRRIPSDKLVVHSYRFKPEPDGRMYDRNFKYDTFRKRCQGLAADGTYSFVVTADIADFFPRIYSHALENALRACPAQGDHVTAITRLIKNWNYRVSYGIPVGPTAARLLAELTISDVDNALLSEGIAFCRFSDDYRMFCGNERVAYEALAFLANVLFENHGLTLQQYKTEILPIDAFQARYLTTESSVESASLTERFEEILNELGIEDPYEPIQYDDLEEDIQAKIDALNLTGILEEQISSKREIDVMVTRFVLRRLAQLDDSGSVDLVLDNIARLYPVFRDALCYVRSMRTISRTERLRIGRRLLDLISDSIVGHLEYHRGWILDTFTHDREWDNEGDFARLYNQHHDEFSRRKLILAMGRSSQQHWFKTRKRTFLQYGPWERRAFLAAASCLPGDEWDHWRRSLQPHLDELEKAVVEWAKVNRFG